jgi:hypothetical protein
MGWFSHDSEESNAWNTASAPETHKSKFTHELIAAAASYEVHTTHHAHLESILILYRLRAPTRNTLRRSELLFFLFPIPILTAAFSGKPASHDEAKALLAGFAGGFVDKLVETKGLDGIDAARAKHDGLSRISLTNQSFTYNWMFPQRTRRRHRNSPIRGIIRYDGL